MPQYTTLIFILVLSLNAWLKFYLNKRQISAINASFSQVPYYFAQSVSLIEHQKAARYNLAKLKLGNFEIAIDVIVLILFTLGGGIQSLIDITNLPNYPLTSQVLFIFSFALMSALIALPLNIYRTFNLEQRFGFNQTTGSLFIKDQIKGLLLLLLIGTPLFYAVAWIMAHLTQHWWIYVWLVVICLNLLALIVYPTFIAPLFNKFAPLSDAELQYKIEKLLSKCGFKSQGIFVMDGSKRSSHGNAYFTGLGASKRIVFFDTLLKQLNHEQIIAVLAHELGHFKHHHILKQMFISFGLTLASLFIFSLLIHQTWFYQALNVQSINNMVGLLLLFLLSGIITLPLTPMFSYMLRHNEFEADKFAKNQVNARDLITALVAMYRDNASTLTPDPVYVKFYYSHPPASIRIAKLEHN